MKELQVPDLLRFIFKFRYLVVDLHQILLCFVKQADRHGELVVPKKLHCCVVQIDDKMFEITQDCHSGALRAIYFAIVIVEQFLVLFRVKLFFILLRQSELSFLILQIIVRFVEIVPILLGILDLVLLDFHAEGFFRDLLRQLVSIYWQLETSLVLVTVCLRLFLGDLDFLAV